MIAPTLAAEAEKLGIIKNQGDRILGRLSRQRAKKLAFLKDNMISRHVTIAFSAEMAGLDGSTCWISRTCRRATARWVSAHRQPPISPPTSKEAMRLP
jgi:hypothetical protein